MEQKKELIYGLNDRPPLRETIFAAEIGRAHV